MLQIGFARLASPDVENQRKANGMTYNRILELQFLFLSVGDGLVLFGLFGPPDRISLFS